MSERTVVAGPHQGQPISITGKPLQHAVAAVIMLHGRGASAQSILELAEEFQRPDFTYLAPHALGNSWYPRSFQAPLETNEPYLSSALEAVTNCLIKISAAGLSPNRTVVIGFSQGACLALEYAAHFPRRYGGIVGLSGSLIGPPGTQHGGEARLDGTPILLACGDDDPHIPLECFHETARTLRGLDGNVMEKIYPSLGHTVCQDEIAQIEVLLDGVMSELNE